MSEKGMVAGPPPGFSPFTPTVVPALPGQTPNTPLPQTPNQTPGQGHGQSHKTGLDQIPELERVVVDLVAETAARVAGDATNASAITAEAATRAAADTNLNNRITTLEGLTESKGFLNAGVQLTSNSTTFQDIISFALPINTQWHFRGTIILLSTVAAKAKFQFTIPAGANLYFSSGQYLDATGTPTLVQGAPASTPIQVQGNGANIPIEVWGVYTVGGTAGSIKLQAAQNVATVETSDFVVQYTNFQFTKF